MPPTEVRPQTFAVLQQPDSASKRGTVSAKASWYLLLGYFTCTSFSVQNPIYPVFKVHRTYCLVFAFQYKTIVQRLGFLLYKDSASKLSTYLRRKRRGFRPMITRMNLISPIIDNSLGSTISC